MTRAGFGDRLFTLTNLVTIALSLCARVVVPEICKVLQKSHNNGKETNCSLSWRDYVEIYTPTAADWRTSPLDIDASIVHWSPLTQDPLPDLPHNQVIIYQAFGAFHAAHKRVTALTKAGKRFAWHLPDWEDGNETENRAKFGDERNEWFATSVVLGDKCSIGVAAFHSDHSMNNGTSYDCGCVKVRASGYVLDTGRIALADLGGAGSYISLHIRRGDKMSATWSETEECSPQDREPAEIANAFKCGLHAHSSETVVYFTDDDDTAFNANLKTELLAVKGVHKVIRGDHLVSNTLARKQPWLTDDNYMIYQVCLFLAEQSEADYTWGTDGQCGPGKCAVEVVHNKDEIGMSSPHGPEESPASSSHGLFADSTTLAQHSKRRLIVAHHKSGSVMATEAVHAANAEIGSSCVSTKAGKVPEECLSMATNGMNFSQHAGLRPPNRKMTVQPPPLLQGMKMVHFARNPFEMVVSSYNYDLENTEAWQNIGMQSISQCIHRLGGGGGGDEAVAEHIVACESTHAVALAAKKGGPLHGVLPAASSGKSWYEYLTALDEDEALLAEAVMMINRSVANMARVHTYIGSLPPSQAQTACESTYDDASMEDCTASWTTLLEAISLPAWPSVARVATAAAKASCPDSPAVLATLPTHSTTDSSNLTKQADQVARLRRLDKKHLQGALANYTHTVGCVLSKRYRESGTHGAEAASSQ